MEDVLLASSSSSSSCSSWMKPLCMWVMALVLLLKLGVTLWWRPCKIQAHFCRQGIRGPPYRFFIGNVHQVVSMMLQASSQPIFPFSHNILPRVLSFYHHWNKLYGTHTVLYNTIHLSKSLLHSSPLFLFLP